MELSEYLRVKTWSSGTYRSYLRGKGRSDCLEELLLDILLVEEGDESALPRILDERLPLLNDWYSGYEEEGEAREERLRVLADKEVYLHLVRRLKKTLRMRRSYKMSCLWTTAHEGINDWNKWRNILLFSELVAL